MFPLESHSFNLAILFIDGRDKLGSRDKKIIKLGEKEKLSGCSRDLCFKRRRSFSGSSRL